MGDNMVNEAVSTACWSNEKHKGLAFPTSISLNNCVGNYILENGQDDYNTIKDGDIVKIEVGVNIGGCIAVCGETINARKKTDKYVKFLNTLQKGVVKRLKGTDTINDDIKTYIERECTNNNCFPVENTFSYQHVNGHLKTADSKYIVLNHKKYYDEGDNLIVDENICFDIDEGDVFTVNLTIIPDTDKNETEHTYIEKHTPHIYRFNEYHYSLRLKCSKEFTNAVKLKHRNNAFSILPYMNNVKYRLGSREPHENGILDSYPVLYAKDNMPVYHKKFTIVVEKDEALLLRYFSK
jgi:methionine aminopeptidase